MQKFLFILAMAVTMAVSRISYASSGDDLDKAQRVAESFISMLEKDNIPYEIVSGDFADSLKAKVNEKSYETLQQEIRDNISVLNNAKFYMYQRYDGGDKLIYVADFSKTKLMAIILYFDKKQKMTDFTISPLTKQQTQNQAE